MISIRQCRFFPTAAGYQVYNGASVFVPGNRGWLLKLRSLNSLLDMNFDLKKYELYPIHHIHI